MRKRNLFDDPLEMQPHWDLGLMGAVLLSNCVIVLIRKEIGPRLIPIVWMGVTHCGIFAAGYLELSAPHATASMMVDGLGLALLAGLSSAAAGMHRWRGRLEATSAETYIHSRSRGRSVGLLRGICKHESTVQRWVEPIAIFLLGVYLLKHGFILCAGFFLVAGACLAAVESVVTKNERGALMDLRDSRAEARHLKDKDAEPAAEVKRERASRPAPHAKPVTSSPELSRLMRDKKRSSSRE